MQDLRDLTALPSLGSEAMTVLTQEMAATRIQGGHASASCKDWRIPTFQHPLGHVKVPQALCETAVAHGSGLGQVGVV